MPPDTHALHVCVGSKSLILSMNAGESGERETCLVSDHGATYWAAAKFNLNTVPPPDGPAWLVVP